MCVTDRQTDRQREREKEREREIERESQRESARVAHDKVRQAQSRVSSSCSWREGGREGGSGEKEPDSAASGAEYLPSEWGSPAGLRDLLSHDGTRQGKRAHLSS